MLSIKRMKVINDDGMLESKLQIIAEMDVKRTEKFIEQDGIDDVLEELGKQITDKIIKYMEQY